MARLADLLTGQGALVRPEGAVGLAVAGIGRTEIGELAYRHGILLHELADRVVEQPAPRAALPLSSGRSGQVRIQSATETAPAPRGPSVPRLRRPSAPVYALRSAAGPAGERPAIPAAAETAPAPASALTSASAGPAATAVPVHPVQPVHPVHPVHPAPQAGPDHRSE